jgi:hypothetical protein
MKVLNASCINHEKNSSRDNEQGYITWKSRAETLGQLTWDPGQAAKSAFDSSQKLGHEVPQVSHQTASTLLL